MLFNCNSGIYLTAKDLKKYELSEQKALKISHLNFKTAKDTYFLINENFEHIIKDLTEKNMRKCFY